MSFGEEAQRRALAAFGQARIEVAHTCYSASLDMDEVGAVATPQGIRVDAVDRCL